MYSSVVIGLCPACGGLVLNAFQERENGSTYNEISVCTKCHEEYTGNERMVITNIPTYALRTNVGRINNLLANFSDTKHMNTNIVEWDYLPSAEELKNGTSAFSKHVEVFNEMRPMIDAAIVDTLHENLMSNQSPSKNLAAYIDLDKINQLTEDRINAVTLIMMSDRDDNGTYSKVYKNSKDNHWTLEIDLGYGVLNYDTSLRYNKFGIVTKKSLANLVADVLNLKTERLNAYKCYEEDIKEALKNMVQKGEREAVIEFRYDRTHDEGTYGRLLEYLESKGYTTRSSNPSEDGSIYIGISIE